MEPTTGRAPTPKSRSARNAEYSASEKGQASRARARSAYRGTEKGRRSRKDESYNRRDREWLSREFVAWDGEGVTRDDGSHDYILFGSSRGHRLRSVRGLSTKAILDFAVNSKIPGTTNVIYGASYDWNMWLGALDAEHMEKLYKDGEVYWDDFRLSWRQGKVFSIWRKSDGESVMFYDVVSFFQSSFVKACDSYLGDEFEDRERVAENKMLRSSFRAADLDEIDLYMSAELRNLVKLMNELRTRLYNAGLKPARWDGPGAIAVALFRREGVGDHMHQSPPEVMPAVRHAYFGGRFEVVKCGHVEGKAYEYDINSAYPWALQDVPSFRSGQWKHVEGDPGHANFALYHLRYESATAPSFPQPLPCRYEDGSVAYPRACTGWYWTPEYDVAREYIALYGGRLQVLEAWVYEPGPDENPFSFVEPLFNKRRALKKAGDGAHVGIKLGLNSMYGKLAQQLGWRRDGQGNVHIPPYHQLEWAGYVTSKCRAAVLGGALPVLDRVIAWETDAMFTEVPLEVPEGSHLGEWEYTEFNDLTYLQSGMYFATTAEGEVVAKTRGTDLGSLTRPDVLAALRRNDTHVPARLTRFTTIGQALQGRWAHWRRWETADKQIALVPGGKRMHIECDECRDGFTLGRWHSTILAPWATDQHSVEYTIEWEKENKELEALRRSHYEGSRYDD